MGSLPVRVRWRSAFRVVAFGLLLLGGLTVDPSSLRADGADDPILKPGDPAPGFTLPGTDGRIHTLAEHRGVRPVVIAWFPKAFAKE